MTGALPALAQNAHVHDRPAVLAPGYAALSFEAPAAGSYILPVLGHAHDGAVVDQRGRPVRLADVLAGRVVVLSFIYTSCSDVNGCPLASWVLSRVQERLRTARLLSSVRLVSMSFDPANDTPAQLSAYARNFRQPDVDWRFLTTTGLQELAPILHDYDQFVIRETDVDGAPTGAISHVLRVLLIDSQQNIRNIYSVSFLHADLLVNDIRTVLAQTSAVSSATSPAVTASRPALRPEP